MFDWLRRRLTIVEKCASVGTIQKLQAAVVYWTPVSTLRITFPAGGSTVDPICEFGGLCSSVALTVSTLYDAIAGMSTSECLRVPGLTHSLVVLIY